MSFFHRFGAWSRKPTWTAMVESTSRNFHNWCKLRPPGEPPLHPNKMEEIQSVTRTRFWEKSFLSNPSEPDNCCDSINNREDNEAVFKRHLLSVPLVNLIYFLKIMTLHNSSLDLMTYISTRKRMPIILKKEILWTTHIAKKKWNHSRFMKVGQNIRTLLLRPRTYFIQFPSCQTTTVWCLASRFYKHRSRGSGIKKLGRVTPLFTSFRGMNWRWNLILRDVFPLRMTFVSSFKRYFDNERKKVLKDKNSNVPNSDCNKSTPSVFYSKWFTVRECVWWMGMKKSRRRISMSEKQQLLQQQQLGVPSKLLLLNLPSFFVEWAGVDECSKCVLTAHTHITFARATSAA